MANQDSKQDRNHFPALIAHTGTAGTAETVRLVANSDGQLETTASVSAPGTQTVGGAAAAGAAAADNPVLIGGTDAGGTVYAPLVTAAGAVSVTGASAGTVVEVNKGTINLGTSVISSLPDLPGGTVDLVSSVTDVANLAKGTITEVGSIANIGMLHAGTVVTTLGDLSGGTIDLLSNITTGSLSNIAMLHAGTVDVTDRAARDLGKVDIASFDVDLPGGTVDLVTGVTTVSSVTNLAAGTVSEVGTVTGVGVVTTVTDVTDVSNLTKGTVSMIHAGTVDTVGAVTSVSNLVKGTVTSVEALPDLPGGTVDLITALATGTIGGKAASGAAAVANPVLMAGTDAGGTVYAPKVSSSGVLSTDASLVLDTGTITTGSLSDIATLHNGTVVVSAINDDINGGTIDLVTRTGNLGTLELGSVTVNAALPAGDNNIGNVDIVTLPDLPGGTVDLVTTVSTVTDVTDVSNLTKGTITSVEALPDLPGGTVDLLTNLAGGTVQINSNPVSLGTPFHVRGTAGAASWGTLIATAGAGTFQYVSNVDIVVVSGTVDVAVTNIGIGGSAGAGVMARGQFNPGGGLSKQFNPVLKSGAAGTLAYWMGGAGTVDITVTYWQAT